MRLLKVLTGLGEYKYATADQAEYSVSDRFVRMFVDSVISIEAAGNIIVIKTLAGSANVAGEAIDSMRWPEIVGTLSGDNTIFVIVHNEADAEEVVRKFNEILR
jgi:transcriptional regulator of arginine metabolism